MYVRTADVWAGSRTAGASQPHPKNGTLLEEGRHYAPKRSPDASYREPDRLLAPAALDPNEPLRDARVEDLGPARSGLSKRERERGAGRAQEREDEARVRRARV
jgi:hypothetical protein